jgi:hypothetical protein
MIDVTDQGWVYNPKTQISGGIGEGQDSVSGVRRLQVTGKYIFGASDTHWFGSEEKPSSATDLYFVLDTQTGKRTNFTNSQDLSRAASQLGIQLKLEDINAIYSRYRFTWFDLAVGVLLILPPTLYFFILARRILKLRRMQYPSPAVA